MIMSCTCKHEGQDALHGIGKRVFNERKDASRARCSVCKAEKSTSKSPLPTIKGK